MTIGGDAGALFLAASDDFDSGKHDKDFFQTAGTDAALQYLEPSREAVYSSSIKKGLKKTVDKAIEESQEAGRFLDRIVAIIYEISVIIIQM